MESILQSKYLHSLEQRLACADQQRREETKSLALRGEAAVLASRVAVLRHACTRAGITLHALPQMEIIALDSSMESNLDLNLESNLGSTLKDPNTLPCMAKPQPLSLTPWNLIFRKLYPGQISHLRQHQRSLIDTIVLNDYLIPRLGSEAATTCLMNSSVGTNSFYGIPADLLEPFNDWIVIKMEEVSNMDEFSMSNKRRKSAPASRQNTSNVLTSTSMSPVPPNEGILSTVSAKAKAPPASFISPSAIAELRADLGLVNTTPPAPLLYSGLMNRDLTWVDVIRGRYPTFNRPSVHMSKTASQYLEKHGMKTAAFLKYMESHFLKNGVFGDTKMHGKLNNSTSNAEEETENHDGSNALTTNVRSGSWSVTSSEKSENSFSEDEVMPVSNRARERRTSENPSRDKFNEESAASLLADRDWKSALNDDQRLYLAEHAKATKLLLRVRNQTHDFVKAKCERAGLSMVDTPTGFCVPEAFVNDLQKWFENAMVRHFQEPAPSSELHSSIGEAAATACDKVSRNSEQMDADSDSQFSSKKAKEDKEEIRNAAPETAKNPQNIYHSASGLRITKYNAILVDIMPDFYTLSIKARIAVKRGVRLFLQRGMGDRFRECMFTLKGAEHHSYGVPDDLLAGFRDWAVEELGKMFSGQTGS